MRQRFGQHFLKAPGTIAKIVAALNLVPEDRVLEIGPGRGALTKLLVPNVEKLLLVEKDRTLAEPLREKFSPDARIQVRSEDFLDTPVEEIRSFLGANFKVISNLPYQVAVAILTKLLRLAPPETTLVLMFQKEVADRIAGVPRSKAYGSLSVFAQLHAEIDRVMVVGPGAFHPPPEVESAVLRFRTRELPFSEEKSERFEALVKAGFAQRRKMLRQNLKAFWQIPAEAVERRLVEVGAAETARAEELGLEQWVSLSLRTGTDSV